jgi:hypothetical protein
MLLDPKTATCPQLKAWTRHSRRRDRSRRSLGRVLVRNEDGWQIVLGLAPRRGERYRLTERSGRQNFRRPVSFRDAASLGRGRWSFDHPLADAFQGFAELLSPGGWCL